MKRQVSLQHKSQSQTSTARYAPQTLSSPGRMKPKSGDKEDEDGDDQDDHFEGDPRPMPYDFEKELINNSNKHIRISEVFGPPNIVYPITSKFYSKYEPQSILKKPAQAQRHRFHKAPPDYPLLESQMYGWMPLQCREAATYLNCIHAPKRRCRMTIHGEQIIAGRITERPPFNGLKFILH
ncbi:uncharacterized protein LOC6585194 [Drosophila mojavensis]|uniref:Uncharacterized protein, isoform A n=2 Tax=Drosophila mojavensis TaxID=7230 RepID=B4L5M6_DROMO|nr:uncharacterized protein LOC6585194 [Drosophila mojavensis]EDW06485.2 uncharacterized protein Dmoj_GI21758, isoform A [Drosophila mojavensis]